MTFMLVAVTLFFVLVGLLVLTISFSGLKESARELCEKNALLLVTKLANSPEFSCGEAFGTTKTNCVDGDKIMALKDKIETYQDFWGVTNIEIRKVYPKMNSEVICNLGNYPDCNIIKLRSKDISGFDLTNYVSLCRKIYENGQIYNKCELAKIMISYDWGQKC